MVVVVQIHFSPVTQRQQPVLTESTGTRSSLGIKNFTVDLIILRLSGVLLFLLCFEQGYDLSSNRAPEAPSTHLQLRYETSNQTVVAQKPQRHAQVLVHVGSSV